MNVDFHSPPLWVVLLVIFGSFAFTPIVGVEIVVRWAGYLGSACLAWIGAVWLAFEAWAATMRRDTLLRICRQWRSDVDEARYLLNTNETSCRAFVEKIARREVLND